MVKFLTLLLVRVRMKLILLEVKVIEIPQFTLLASTRYLTS